MQGKNLFTEREIAELRQLVKKFNSSNMASERKTIRSKFRKLEFYVSDFGIRNIDITQFDKLLKSGEIKKVGGKRTGIKNSRSEKPVSLNQKEIQSGRRLDSNFSDLEKNLINGKFISAAVLDLQPNLDCAGLYCIRLKKGSKLPPRYHCYLKERKHPIIYLGKAEGQTLRKRFLGQELRARGHGTFFRSIGAVLGFVPEKGSLLSYRNKKNYKFTSKDEAAIINWINANLEVNWVQYAADFSIEKSFIQKYCPLLNHSHNPSKLQELIEDKLNCRLIANNN